MNENVGGFPPPFSEHNVTRVIYLYMLWGIPQANSGRKCKRHAIPASVIHNAVCDFKDGTAAQTQNRRCGQTVSLAFTFGHNWNYSVDRSGCHSYKRVALTWIQICTVLGYWQLSHWTTISCTFQNIHHITYKNTHSKVLSKFQFIQLLMHQWVVLRTNIKIYTKTAPTCFGVITPF